MIFKKNIKTTLFTIIFAITITFIYSNSYAVDPVYYDFKEVGLNTTSNATVSISTNSSSEVVLKSMSLQSGIYFEILTEMPDDGIVIPPNETVGIKIAFTPTILDSVSDVMYIRTNNPFIGRVVVYLSGTGVPSADITIDDILGFFDSSVASGTMVGNGGANSDDNLLAYKVDNQKKKKSGNQGKSAENKLHALRNMIVSAGKLIESEDLDGACRQLMSISKKCDGKDRPPDFVLGAGQPNPVPQLENMIENLSESLECM
jgi:hypothetical protein